MISYGLSWTLNFLIKSLFVSNCAKIMKFDRIIPTIIPEQTLELIILFITLTRLKFSKYNNEFGWTLLTFMVRMLSLF